MKTAARPCVPVHTRQSTHAHASTAPTRSTAHTTSSATRTRRARTFRHRLALGRASSPRPSTWPDQRAAWSGAARASARRSLSAAPAQRVQRLSSCAQNPLLRTRPAPALAPTLTLTPALAPAAAPAARPCSYRHVHPAVRELLHNATTAAVVRTGIAMSPWHSSARLSTPSGPTHPVVLRHAYVAARNAAVLRHAYAAVAMLVRRQAAEAAGLLELLRGPRSRHESTEISTRADTRNSK